jgi:phospholipase C
LATRDRPWVRLAIPPLRGADALNSPNFSPGESFSEVNRQHYGKEKVTDDEAKRPPGMKGFVKDYVHVLRHDRKCPDEQIVRYAHQVMQSFTPDQLPVLNGLARHYAVSDMWFSSVPSQTNTNRAFAFCGTSNGMVNNGFLEEGDKAKPIEELVGYKLGDDRVRAKTIFNALADDGKTTWKLFYRCGMLQDNIAKAIDAFRTGEAVGGGLSLLSPLPGLQGLAFFSLADMVAEITLLAKHIDLEYLRGLSNSSVESMYSHRLFPKLAEIADKDVNCAKFEKFHEQARSGTLPNFTFIEPVWSISPQSTGSHLSNLNFLYHLGDDYHRPCNLDGGETL